AGTELDPVLVSVPVNLLAPSAFHVVAPKIDFGMVEGTPELTANLPLSGSGCVWIAESMKPEISASPEDLGAITISSPENTGPENCLAAKDGGSLPLTLKAEHAGNGSITGQLAVMIAPNGEPDKAMAVDVDFTSSVSRPINTGNFLL